MISQKKRGIGGMEIREKGITDLAAPPDSCRSRVEGFPRSAPRHSGCPGSGSAPPIDVEVSSRNTHEHGTIPRYRGWFASRTFDPECHEDPRRPSRPDGTAVREPAVDD